MTITEIKSINRTQAKRLLRRLRRERQRETITVWFYKRSNNALRKMTCQFGVRRGLTGRGHAFKPGYLHLMTAWDTRKKKYRFISLERLVAVRVGTTRYEVRA